MEHKNKIGIKELLAFVFSICIATFPAFGTAMILAITKQSSLISVLIGLVLGLIPLGMILYIAKFIENKTIFQLNKDKFKFFGEIINILYVICIIFFGFIISWTAINFTITQLLLRTSYYLVAIVLFSIIGYAVTKGVEVIGRSNFLLNIIGISTLIFVILFLIPSVKLDNLFPILAVSKKTIIMTSLYIPSITVAPLISILYIKKNDIEDNHKYNKAIFIGYLLSGLIAFIFFFLIISVYGTNIASLLSYPEYYLFKKINAFEFISRIENFAAIMIYICFFGNMCILISFVKTYLQEKFNIKKELNVNILIFALAIIVPIISIYIFKNYHPVFIFKNYPLFASAIFIPLFFNFILLLFARKKRS